MKPLVEAGSKFVSASGGKDGAKFANDCKGNTAGRGGEQLGAFQWGKLRSWLVKNYRLVKSHRSVIRNTNG